MASHPAGGVRWDEPKGLGAVFRWTFPLAHPQSYGGQFALAQGMLRQSGNSYELCRGAEGQTALTANAIAHGPRSSIGDTAQRTLAGRITQWNGLDEANRPSTGVLYMTLVVHEEFIYGTSGGYCTPGGRLERIELTSGKVRWQSDGPCAWHR